MGRWAQIQEGKMGTQQMARKHSGSSRVPGQAPTPEGVQKQEHSPSFRPLFVHFGLVSAILACWTRGELQHARPLLLGSKSV